MARPIIDFEVERRQMSHAKLYNDVVAIPMYQKDVVQSMDVIRLSKPSKEYGKMSFLEGLLLTNSIAPDEHNREGTFVTVLKDIKVSAEVLAEIKSILVCTISVSPTLSRGITDACVDYASGNVRKKRPSGKEDNSKLYLTEPKVDLLYYTIYDEVYDKLIELCGPINVMDAASKMGGD